MWPPVLTNFILPWLNKFVICEKQVQCRLNYCINIVQHNYFTNLKWIALFWETSYSNLVKLKKKLITNFKMVYIRLFFFFFVIQFSDSCSIRWKHIIMIFWKSTSFTNLVKFKKFSNKFLNGIYLNSFLP